MILNVLLKVSSILFPLITFPYVSRILMPSGIGRVSFANSFVAYFAMFAQLGVPTYGIRECAKVRDDKEELTRVTHELLFINFAATVVVYIAFIFAVVTIPRVKADKILMLLMGGSIGLKSLSAEWLYSGLEDYEYIAKRQITCNFIAILGVLALVRKPEDYLFYGGLIVFSASAAGVLNFINLRKHICMKWMGGYHITRHFRMVMTFFLLSVASVIYTNLDTVMLGFMKPDTEVGYYTTSVKIKDLLVTMTTAVSAVLLPRASYYVDKKMYEEFYGIIKKVMRYMVIGVVPMAAYFMIFAPAGIGFFAGKEFLNSVISMRIIMPVLVFISITNIIGIQMLVPLGKEIEVLKSVSIGAITDLVLNAILIPKYGSAGAAIGTLAAEWIVLIYQIFVCIRMKVNVFSDVPIIKILFGTMLSACMSFAIYKLNIGYFLMLLCSATVFFAVYMLLMLMDKGIRKDIKDLIVR